jgi:hypothetical protein
MSCYYAVLLRYAVLLPCLDMLYCYVVLLPCLATLYCYTVHFFLVHTSIFKSTCVTFYNVVWNILLAWWKWQNTTNSGADKVGMYQPSPDTRSKIWIVLTVRQILLVGKYKNDGVPHLSVVDNPVKLLSSLINTISVCTVHDKDEALCPSVIVSPERSDLVLPSNILQYTQH